MAAEMLVERDLFANPDVWISNSGPSINDPPSKYFEASTIPEAMLITNGLDKAWGGALVSNTIQPPADSTGKLMNWIAFRLKFRLPGATAKNCARLETDLKVCVKTRPNAQTWIRNVCNFSTQWNADTGQWQIDKDPPAWINTGFIVNEIAPDVWHTLEFRFTFDEAALTFSVLSIQLDDQLYMIPDELQGVMMTNTNWEKCRKLQLQNEGYKARSTVLVEYRDGELAWSNERITMIPPASTQTGEDIDAHQEG